jgi:mono/diheme cytochrome c family protein
MKVWPFGFLALLVGLDPAATVEKGTVDRGELLLRKNCSRCHAIGTTGESPHPEAPPFRTLSSR